MAARCEQDITISVRFTRYFSNGPRERFERASEQPIPTPASMTQRAIAADRGQSHEWVGLASGMMQPECVGWTLWIKDDRPPVRIG
jgi:hypothetical protein